MRFSIDGPALDLVGSDPSWNELGSSGSGCEQKAASWARAGFDGGALPSWLRREKSSSGDAIGGDVRLRERRGDDVSLGEGGLVGEP